MRVFMHHYFSEDRLTPRKAWLLGVVVLASALWVRGGEPRTLPLTLKQALERALDQNPQVHRAVLALAQGQEDTRAAQAALLPTVDAFWLHTAQQSQSRHLPGSTEPGRPHGCRPVRLGRGRSRGAHHPV